MTRKPQQGVSDDTLSSYQEQCADLGRDWQRLRDLLNACHDTHADRERLEWELMALRSKLSCDYPILTYWRKGGYGLSGGINRLMSGAPTAASLAESALDPASGVNQLWGEVWQSLEKVSRALAAARQQLDQGKAAQLPPELLQYDTHVPFPVRRILQVAGVTAATTAAITLLYIMRNFLGFWAPETGSSLMVSEGMADDAKIESVLVVMNESFRSNDVDRFMTVIADDFRDENGNGKTALRVALQAFKEQGQFGTVSMDWSRIRITERDGLLDVRPIFIVTPEESISINAGFKSYGGKLLIATGSGA